VFAFADIGKAVDAPVKTYSSGMVVRLAFAVNTALDPDLLITDEVLAVGDMAFQKKCIAWLEGYLAGGGAMLLVSHSLYHVQKLCQRALWLHRGQVQAEGDVFDVSRAYLAHHEARLAAFRADESAGVEAVTVKDLTLGDDRSPREQAHLHRGDALRVHASVRGTADRWRIELRRNDESVITCREIDHDGSDRLDLRLDTRPFLPGRYQFRLTPLLGEDQAGPMIRRLLEIEGRSRAFGSIELDHRWSKGA